MNVVVEYVHADIERRIANPRYRIIVEIALLDGTSTGRDLSMTGNCMAEHDSTFDLLAYPLGIYVATAINGNVHLRDMQRTIVANHDMYCSCNIAMK